MPTKASIEVYMGLCEYEAKVRALSNDPYAIREFSSGEIAEAVVDIFAARDSLSPWEYEYIRHLYRHYLADFRVMRLDASSHRSVYLSLLASFDIIAELEQYCFCEAANLRSVGAEVRRHYRETARELIDRGRLFSSEWWELCRKYCIELWYKNGFFH